MHSDTPTVAAQLPYFQPHWTQSSWSNVYQHEPPLAFQHYDTTAYYAAEDMTARNVGFQQQASVSCPADWYLDDMGNPQALQTSLSFQVIFCHYFPIKN